MIWNGRKVGRWVYDDGLVGNTNPFVFLLVERNTHSYPNGAAPRDRWPTACGPSSRPIDFLELGVADRAARC
jgi:hypothetical protein